MSDSLKQQQLIGQCLQGSQRAQYQLYQLYAKAMFNVCFRMMNRFEDAEDMLQEAFSEAFRKLGSFRNESTFGAWLKRIVVNRCINEMRKRKVELTFVDDFQLYESRFDEEWNHPGLSTEKVRKAMSALPNGSRVVFSLYLLEGYDHQEIAGILNISVSNSKTQYMRARQRVKEILTQNDNEN